jgi:hypothetical protein
MVSQRFARRAPRLQYRQGRGCFFGAYTVDEPVHRRQMLGLQRGQDGVRYIEPRLTRRQLTMRRQVIEGDGDLLSRGGNRHKTEEKNETSSKH